MLWYGATVDRFYYAERACEQGSIEAPADDPAAAQRKAAEFFKVAPERQNKIMVLKAG
jgi:hypothetical protein